MNKQYGLLCGTHYPRLYFSYGESTCIILVLYYKLYLCLNSASTELMGAAFLPRNPLLDPENQHDDTAVAKSIFFLHSVASAWMQLLQLLYILSTNSVSKYLLQYGTQLGLIFGACSFPFQPQQQLWFSVGFESQQVDDAILQGLLH